jgi:predicted transposase/invertase (TIGR01784 family)
MKKSRPGTESKFDLHHPYDSLVRLTFTIKRFIVAFLKVYLPPRIAALMEWPSLRVERGSFISSELRSRYSDVLVSVNFAGHPLRIYFLVEHKSVQENRVVGQVFELISELIQRSRQENGRLVPVLALILHHGGRPWKGSLRMIDHYGLPEEHLALFSGWLLSYEAVLVDLAAMKMEQIKNIPPVEATLKALKAVSEGQETAYLKELRAMVRKKGNLQGHLSVLLLHLLAVSKSTPKEELVEIAKDSQDTRVISEVMTLAERIKSEGREEGREEGRRQGQQQGRLQGQQEGILIGQIRTFEKVLKLPATPISQLQRLKLAELEKRLRKLESRQFGKN